MGKSKLSTLGDKLDKLGFEYMGNKCGILVFQKPFISDTKNDLVSTVYVGVTHEDIDIHSEKGEFTVCLLEMPFINPKSYAIGKHSLVGVWEQLHLAIRCIETTHTNVTRKFKNKEKLMT